MLSSVWSEKQKSRQEYIAAALAKSAIDDDVAMTKQTSYVYLLLMKLKGYRNRTFLLVKNEIPKENNLLLLSLQISVRKRNTLKDLRKRWAKESRGVKGRLKKGIELATLYKCKFKIHQQTTSGK